MESVEINYIDIVNNITHIGMQYNTPIRVIQEVIETIDLLVTSSRLQVADIHLIDFYAIFINSTTRKTKRNDIIDSLSGDIKRIKRVNTEKYENITEDVDTDACEPSAKRIAFS